MYIYIIFNFDYFFLPYIILDAYYNSVSESKQLFKRIKNNTTVI